MNEAFSASRRGVLGLTGLSLAAAMTGGRAVASARSSSPFPKGFLWGAGSAGHQIEGNNVLSDMWQIEHAEGSLFPPSGDACDSLNRWQQDLDMAQALGLGAFRFSVEWSRIEPEPGLFSAGYLDHYKAIVDGCRQRGLAPVVAFNHFALPFWFSAMGGFQHADGPALFARYCGKVARHMGAQISHALTLNEPNAAAQIRWAGMPDAFAQKLAANIDAVRRKRNAPAFSSAVFSTGDGAEGLIAGHVEAFKAIKAEHTNLPVSIGLSLDDDQFEGSPVARDRKRKDVYAPWFDAIRAHGDFIGVQNYGRRMFDATGQKRLPKAEGNGRENLPECVSNAVRYAHEQTGKPVLVTENGLNTHDDAVRQAYIKEAVAGLRKVVTDGVPLLGYLHWSLLDSYEWISGYDASFGLVAVDRTTFARTAKGSGKLLGTIARTNGSV